MSIVYLEFLRRKNNVVGYFDNQDFAKVSDEDFYDFIDFIYFSKKSSYEEFVSYLKKKDREEEISEWMVRVNRFNTYNFLLDGIFYFLKDSGFDTGDDISDVISMMLNQIHDTLFSSFMAGSTILPPLSFEECDKLFYEFLDDIGAPYSWKNKYNELKEDGRLSYKKKSSEEEISCCKRLENGKYGVIIAAGGTVLDFRTLVHEFSHYISMENGMNIEFSILELSSIFFENMAIDFLKKKGYSDEVISAIVHERTKNNLAISPVMASLFSDVVQYVKDGIVTKEKKIAVYNNMNRKIEEVKKSFIEKNMDIGDLANLSFDDQKIEEMVCNDCDNLTMAFLSDGILILDGYQYVVDTFVAGKLLEKASDDPTIVLEMFRITERLGQTSLNGILEKFNMKDIFSKESAKVMKRAEDRSKFKF